MRAMLGRDLVSPYVDLEWFGAGKTMLTFTQSARSKDSLRERLVYDLTEQSIPQFAQVRRP